MKILLTADWHLDRNNRISDFAKSIQVMVDLAIADNIRKFFIIGDIYRDWQASPVEKDLFHQVLVKLYKHKIDTYVILGNHDIDEKNIANPITAVQELATLKALNVAVIAEPSLIPIGTKTILALPHLSKRFLEAERKKAKAEVSYVDVLRRYAAHSPSLVLGHVYLPEAILGASDIGMDSARAVKLEDLTATFKVPMVFGDIHKPQTLCDNPLVAYVGSPDKITFGESTEDKRFLVYDTDAATFQSIPIPTRNFLDIAVDLKGRSIALKGCVNGDLPLGDGDYMVCLRAFFKAIGSTVVGSVLKFSVSGHKNDIDQLIRYEITSSLKALNPATIKAVTFNVTDNTAVRDNAYSTALSDMEAFKLWLSKQDYTDAVRAEVANAATDLLNSK